MSIARTRSGLNFNLAAPHAETLRLSDVAHHLSLINRFAGASEFPISVALHSVNVARVLASWKASAEIRLIGLLHDAHEAFIGDVTSPMKQELSSWAGADHVERSADRIDSILFHKLGLAQHVNPATRRLIAKADAVMLATEWRFAMRGPCPSLETPAAFEVRELHWTKAKEGFQKMLDQLLQECGLPHREAL